MEEHSLAQGSSISASWEVLTWPERNVDRELLTYGWLHNDPLTGFWISIETQLKVFALLLYAGLRCKLKPEPLSASIPVKTTRFGQEFLS